MIEYQFNPTRFREMAIAHGYTKPKRHPGDVDRINVTKLADAMGVSVSMASRMLNDVRNPGSKAMLGLKRAFPNLNDLYFFTQTVANEESRQGTTEVA